MMHTKCTGLLAGRGALTAGRRRLVAGMTLWTDGLRTSFTAATEMAGDGVGASWAGTEATCTGADESVVGLLGEQAATAAIKTTATARRLFTPETFLGPARKRDGVNVPD